MSMETPLALVGGGTVLVALVVAIAYAARVSFLVRQFAFPLLLGAAAAAIEAFVLLDPGPDAAAAAVLSWLLLFLGFALLLRILGLFFFDVHLPARRGMRLPPLLPAVAMLAVYAVAALVTLRLSFPKLDVAPLIATSAVTSLVLGLALQPILGNFFAGLVISLERPFRINDWIRVGEHEGRVVSITWRTTHLRTRDNDNVVIPNGKIADERVLNYYYPHPMRLERILVSAHLDIPPYRVRRALLECAAGVKGLLDKPGPEVYLLSFDDSGMTYELRVWVEDVAQAPRIASDLRNRIWEELKRERIAMPYPTRTLEILPRARRVPAAEGEAPAARLFVAEGPERGRALDLDGAPRTVGRSRSSSLPLTEANASKEHLRIEWTGEGYRMTDLGSSFGTRVNGEPATSALLRPFDRIAIGDTILVFESEHAG